MSISGDDPKMIDALDLPHELHDVQNAYWEAQREWNLLQDAYERVMADMLSRSRGASS